MLIPINYAFSSDEDIKPNILDNINLIGENILIFEKNEPYYLFDYPSSTNDQSNKIIFIVKHPKNKERENNVFIRKKRHRATDDDNILCKIQIHFLNFLVSFANDAIKTEFNGKEKNLSFKNIEHKIKINISHANLKILKKNPIYFVLVGMISDKYKKLSKDKDYNKKIYQKVTNKSIWLKNLFDINYLDAFELYYNDCEIQDSIEFKNKTIKFSDNTKSFYFLHTKAKEEEKNKLKEIIESHYKREKKDAVSKKEIVDEK